MAICAKSFPLHSTS